MRRLLTAAAAVLALAAGCNGADQPPPRLDPEAIAVARERLDDALDTEELVRTDRAEARRLVRELRRGEAGLARVEEAVPSLVDERAARDFLRYAERDGARALRRPAEEEVRDMIALTRGQPKSARISTLEGQTVERYLREAERDVRGIWPDLARRLEQAREELD